jgi:hypothetical protein
VEKNITPMVYLGGSPENIFDGDVSTSGTSYVSSFIDPFGPPTVPYSWYWNYTNGLWAYGNDNTNSSGTITDVYVRIYGNRIQEDYHDALFTLIPYVNDVSLGFDFTFMLPLVSGAELASIPITTAKESWSWDDINTLGVDIHCDGGPWTDMLDFYVCGIELRIITEETGE